MARAIRPNTFLATVAIVSGIGICVAGAVYSSQPGFATVEQRVLVLGSLYVLLFGILYPTAILVIKRLNQLKPVQIPPRKLTRRNQRPHPPSSPAPNAASIRNLQWKPARAVARKAEHALRDVA
jgi:hypothetical protein